ncbi:MAG: hypothetical protein IJE25_05935 [Clostridia bacterium]|nr:hypothetical protein [Clostridia bacterium]
MDKNIDPRLVVSSFINKPDVRFFDVASVPFSLHGVKKYEEGFARLPRSVAERINPRAAKFSKATAGGRVRFRTNSTYIAIRAHLGDIYRISMLTLTLSAGFDLYEGREYLGSFNPPYEIQNGGVYEAALNLGERRERELALNMPQYAQAIDLEIGIDGEATLSPPTDYRISSPIVFYGSSITHGACASRSGLTFVNRISRDLCADVYNLGFGAGCRGELEIAEYIGSLSPSVAVIGYDHNAPNKEKLRATHLPFVERLRSLLPETPIILVSRPDVKESQEGLERFEIIKETYHRLCDSGDKRVHLVFGGELLTSAEHTHDGIHPNDLGEAEISSKLAEYIKTALYVNNY